MKLRHSRLGFERRAREEEKRRGEEEERQRESGKVERQKGREAGKKGQPTRAYREDPRAGPKAQPNSKSQA